MSGRFQRFSLGATRSPSSSSQYRRPAEEPSSPSPEGIKQPLGQPSETTALRRSVPVVNAEPAWKALGHKRQKVHKAPARLKEGTGLPEQLGNQPLRLIIIGTNPSDHAWATGCYYSNPVNWMWRILQRTGIAPATVAGCQDDWRMPGEAGVGFIDVGIGNPGTELCKFSVKVLQGWVPNFYRHILEHCQRAAASVGCCCGKCGAPAMVAFAGKRQYMDMCNVGRKGKQKLTKIGTGVQTDLPEG